MKAITTNSEMDMAWQYIETTNVNVFLTGKAGTGKTTFLRQLQERSDKRMIITAPTGVAAINAGGVTLHSFFQLAITPFIPEMKQEENNRRFMFSKEKKDIIRSMDLLVIDEISMVRADVLDAVDDVLRRHRDGSKPFGGVQLLLIGDLQQLSPVAKNDEWTLLNRYYDTPYFFSSRALKAVELLSIELKTVYRQSDPDFVSLLSKIRTNTDIDNALERLNQRIIPGFDGREGYIRLTTHNHSANSYNKARLDELPTPYVHFRAETDGNFPDTMYPVEEDMALKVGAQVMFVKNDHSGSHRYFNGKIGTITRLNNETIEVKSEGDDTPITVEVETWENTRYEIDDESKAIKAVCEGTFKQYPLRLAWAITVHKSQGLTFDKVVLDLSNAFTHGQVYVALSRCRSLGGIVLTNRVTPDIIMRDSIVESFTEERKKSSENAKELLPARQFAYFKQLLGELFDFSDLERDLMSVMRAMEDYFHSRTPDFLARLNDSLGILRTNVCAIADKFVAGQCNNILEASADYETDPTLQERIAKACVYFSKELHKTFDGIVSDFPVEVANAAVKKRYVRTKDLFIQTLKAHEKLLTFTEGCGFSVDSFLHNRALSVLDNTTVKPAKRTKKKAEKKKEKAIKVDTKAVSYELYKKGLTIEAIARQRDFTTTTILSHLAHYVTTGDISVFDFVDKKKLGRILKVVNTAGNTTTLKELRDMMGGDVTYGDIKMAQAYIAFEKGDAPEN